MSTAPKLEDDWLTDDIWKAVDDTYSKVKKLIIFYNINGSDFVKIDKECPKHMDRIRQIEQTIGPPLSYDEVVALLDSWFRNWDYVFNRRNMFKTRGR